jgi:hypothetical protein
MSKKIMVNQLNEVDNIIKEIELSWLIAHAKKHYGIVASQLIGMLRNGQVIFGATGYCYFDLILVKVEE